MTPPHAKICRERAITAISHPALRLPPLPVVPALGSKEAPGADGASDSSDSTAPSPTRQTAPFRTTGRAFAPAQTSSQAVPAERSVRGMSSFAQHEQPSFQLGEGEDLADFI